jgi:FixJ family two-component response regulator
VRGKQFKCSLKTDNLAEARRKLKDFRNDTGRVDPAAGKITLEALADLGSREREILGFVIAGRLNKVIACELGTTEKTIKKHRGHIMKKWKIGSIAELVHLTLRCGPKPAHSRWD